MRADCRTWLVYLPALLLGVLAAAPAAAQEPEGLTLELAADGADITLHETGSEWWLGRAQLTKNWLGGSAAYLSVEALRRFDATDSVFIGGGHFHAGRWTVAALAGGGPNADFYYRKTTEVELYRDLGAGWVVHGAYRYFDFTTANVHLVSPAVTWYGTRGEVSLRTYLGRNVTNDFDTWSVLARGARDVGSNWRLGGGLSVGEGLFDVTSLAGRPANGWVAFAEARRRLGANVSVGAALRVAHERPDFDQVGLVISFATSLR